MNPEIEVALYMLEKVIESGDEESIKKEVMEMRATEIFSPEMYKHLNSLKDPKKQLRAIIDCIRVEERAKQLAPDLSPEQRAAAITLSNVPYEEQFSALERLCNQKNNDIKNPRSIKPNKTPSIKLWLSITIIVGMIALVLVNNAESIKLLITGNESVSDSRFMNEGQGEESNDTETIYLSKYSECIKEQGGYRNSSVAGCSNYVFKLVSTEIKSTYNELYAKLKRNDVYQTTELKTSQQSWQLYRDSQCRMEATYIGGLMANYCPMKMSIDRLVALKEISDSYIEE
jgi:uncharacterized protein YecT (DUF1311 family)